MWPIDRSGPSCSCLDPAPRDGRPNMSARTVPARRQEFFLPECCRRSDEGISGVPKPLRFLSLSSYLGRETLQIEPRSLEFTDERGNFAICEHAIDNTLVAVLVACFCHTACGSFKPLAPRALGMGT